MMATLFPSPTESSAVPSAADFEPDEHWKDRLKVDIENNLRSMVNEAKQSLQDTLKKAPVSAVERDRLTEEHLATMKNIRILAEEQFRIALERERQERRWAAGQTLDREWSEEIIKEQQAILDKIERERKDKAAQSSSPPSQPTAGASGSHTSARPAERTAWTPQELTRGEHEVDYFPRVANREVDDDHVLLRDTGKARAGSVSSGVGSYKPPSTLDTTDRDFERPKPSPIIDELDDMPRSVRAATDFDSIRRERLRRKASVSNRPLPEFWVPSITPEEDAQMSRTFSMARRGSTASTTSYRAPSVLSIPFSTEPHDMVERERDRISAVDQEWSSFDRARDRERTTSYTYSEARFNSASTPQRLEERYPPTLSSSVAPSPSSTIPIGYPRSSDTSRPHAPPPSASRPIATKKSFSFDDGGFQSSPSPTKGWTGPSRSPYETRHESSRSPQTPDEIPRSWQSSNLRTRLSSQDMRYSYTSSEAGYYPRPVHTHHEVSEGEYDEYLDDTEWQDERRNRQREDDFRRREEEVVRRELELRRREEEVKREEEAKQKEDELRRKEEETKRKEDEIRRKEEEARRRQEEAERKEEETQRKELEIRKKEEEARKKEEETRRKEDEIKRKETLAKRKEEEVRMKEAQARKRAEDLRRQEEEVAKRLDEEARRVELDILRKSEEATRKENEVKRKEEEAKLKEEAARAKEEEIKRKEEELARREEELLRREAEAIRRSDDKQKVQQEEFRKREEEIRRRSEEKKKQERWEWESWGFYPPEPSRPTPPPQKPAAQSSSSGPWPIPNVNRPERTTSGTGLPADKSSFGSTGTSRSSTTWTSSTRPSSTTSSQPSSTPKPPTPSAQQNAKPPPGPSHTPMSEAEFHRRQAEQAQQREEQFRREQARLEQERLAKAGKILNKQDIIKLFEHHRGQWDKLQMSAALKWDDFPWPVFKQPSGPDDVTTPGITAYMLSSLHPADKSPKDRIKENIRRWHPDRFETQLLSKVKDDDRDSVREAAGTVVRTLNDLLRSSTQEFSFS